jgi:hypothetical protein
MRQKADTMFALRWILFTTGANIPVASNIVGTIRTCSKPNDGIGTGARSYRMRKVFQLDQLSRKADLDWLMELIPKRLGENLPCILQAGLVTSLVRDMICKDVKPVCCELLENVDAILLEVSSKLAIQTQYRRVISYIQEVCRTVINNCLLSSKCKIDEKLDCEESPFTLNQFLFEIIAKKRACKLKALIISSVSANPANWANAIESAFEATGAWSMERHMANELELALDAYGKVAAKRIIDEVPMLIRHMCRDVVL